MLEFCVSTLQCTVFHAEMKKKRKEADLKNIISQIGGLENRIKYSQNDLDNTERRSMKEHNEVMEQVFHVLRSKVSLTYDAPQWKRFTSL